MESWGASATLLKQAVLSASSFDRLGDQESAFTAYFSLRFFSKAAALIPTG
jgi:hypothetical protein